MEKTDTGTELIADGVTTKYQWLKKSIEWYSREHIQDKKTIDKLEKQIKILKR
tara:strand:+ start:407 stop:565 length:159 start_codon:yes stop_codon:yes gene_type:complete